MLSRQLRKAQQATAGEAFRQSMKSKVFLSLKFFTVYIKRQTQRNEKAVEYNRKRHVSAGWSSLRLWVEDSKHRRAKTQVVDEFSRMRIMQRWFLAFAIVARERTIERAKRAQADALFTATKGRRIFGHWCVYTLSRKRKSLNKQMADGFRAEKLQRTMFRNLIAAN